MTAPGDALIVAMDGPSGTGKSTVSKRLAQHLGAAYLDTGAMYRIATLHALRPRHRSDRSGRDRRVTAGLPWSIGTDPTVEDIRLDGDDVREIIRGAEVTAAVSAVSAVPEVRTCSSRPSSGSAAPSTASSSKDATSVRSSSPTRT